MLTSTIIAQCRRQFGDNPKSTTKKGLGDGTTTLFSVSPSVPIVEGSYKAYISGVVKTETTDYTIDLDNGDVFFLSAPGSNVSIQIDHKFAFWRDQQWNDAINAAISELNARGFFRQVVRSTSGVTLSASITKYNGPTGCVDMYEVLESDSFTTSGNFRKLSTNWSYRPDANVLVLGSKPSRANYLAISYMRKMNIYQSTSATVDISDDWVEAVKKKAGATFYRYMAGKIATEGNATIDEGHFSFSNLRTQANDMDNEFNQFATRSKPARPAKDMKFHIPGGGEA